MRLSNRHSVRGAGARRRVKPAWASAVGRDDYGDWAEISVGKARQRLRLIRPGKFMMGSPESEAGRFKCEGPQHEVEIRQPFWLFDTACTQALWTAVMGKNPSEFKGKDRPVEQVSWDDAQEFIAKINDRIPGLNLSLPSEAQWEYACRAGTAKPFSFGEVISPDQVNYAGNWGSEKGVSREETVAAGSLPANPWGLYEMHGNVWEWCADAWHETYDGAPPDGSVWESKDRAADRVTRGGCWRLPALFARSAFRLGIEPDDRSDAGFRWANTSELDTLFDALRDEDGDGFHECVIAACGDDQLLAFASNRNSSKRQLFASALVERLVFHLYAPHHLPYEFSRFAGMMSFDDFKAAELERMENVYARCRVVEAMRKSEQEEISNLGDMILDYREDRRRSEASTAKLLQLMNYQIEMSFRPGVTSWTMRSCRSCNDGFKSWLATGAEIEKDRCPFCVLRIPYPQKTGRNAGRL